MGKYLIVGISGAGKTTVANTLSERGFRTVNMDDIETGISFYVDTHTGNYIDRPTPPFDDEWLRRYKWVWDKAGIVEALQAEGDIFLCGDATNETEFYYLFDKIFGLFIPDQKEIVRRLQLREPGRWDDNTPELDEKLERHRQEVERFRDSGIILIDASRQPDEVANEIQSYTRD